MPLLATRSYISNAQPHLYLYGGSAYCTRSWIRNGYNHQYHHHIMHSSPPSPSTTVIIPTTITTNVPIIITTTIASLTFTLLRLSLSCPA